MPLRYAAAKNAHLTCFVFLFVVIEDFTQEVIKFSRSHFLLELRQYQYLAQFPVSLHQYIFVIKENIIDACHAFITQIGVIDGMRAAEHRQIERIMDIMIHIRAGGGEPIDKPVIHQRDNGRRSQPRRSQSARKAQAYRDIRL